MALASGLLAAALATSLLLATVEPAQAAFPGQNGKIAFESFPDGNGEIYAMNSDGTKQINLTQNPNDDSQPAVSADGKKIAFTSDRGNEEIMVMNSDGSGQNFLTLNSASDTHPAFSPDGKIAFQTNRRTPDNIFGDSEIYKMDANGANQTNLTNQPGSSESRPVVSPDSAKIAFVRDRDGNSEVYVMNADGTDQTRLTKNAEFDGEPSFSPDGKKISFASDRSGNFEVYRMSASGKKQKGITKNAVGDFSPDWQPIEKK
jgi:Tol biopolymer transport system component